MDVPSALTWAVKVPRPVVTMGGVSAKLSSRAFSSSGPVPEGMFPLSLELAEALASAPQPDGDVAPSRTSPSSAVRGVFQPMVMTGSPCPPDLQGHPGPSSGDGHGGVPRKTAAALAPLPGGPGATARRAWILPAG